MERANPIAVQFQQAVEEGNAERIRQLFLSHEELKQVVDAPWFAFGAPALVHAVGAGHTELVDALLDVGADPNVRSDWDPGAYTALHRCVDGPTAERLALAHHLVARGATIDLHAAAGLGRVDILEQILDSQPERVSEPGPDGATPLHLAANPETARLLLDRGADIEKRCVDHNSTPLMWSVQGREDVTRFLLQAGAQPDLYVAAVLNDAALAERILEREPDAISVRVRPGESHEHLGHGDKYVWALDFADTPVEVARRRNHKEIYEFLLSRSPATTQLVQACRADNVAAVVRLIDDAPDLLNRLSGYEVREALCGSAATAGVLLERGVDPNTLDDDRATALHHAAWRGDRQLIETLLRHGGDLRIRDGRYDGTPLGWAHHAGRHDLVEFLAANGALDIVDAAWLGKTAIVRKLLDEHPDLANGPDEERVSPLRTAAWFGHLEIVRLLLAHGADPSAPNAETGKTALDHALEQGHQEIADLIRAHPSS